MTSNPGAEPPPAVRFSSTDEVIEPQSSADTMSEKVKPSDRRTSLTQEAQEELRNLSITLQKSRLQTERMENFAYDPVSLPASRVPSGSSQTPTQSGVPSPAHRPSPPVSAVHSPPLTPATSGSKEHKPTIGSSNLRLDQPITPAVSPPHEVPPSSIQQYQPESKPSAAAQARLPKSSQARPRSMIEMSGAVPSQPRHPAHQVIGATGDSPSVSHEVSPAHTPGSVTPGAQSPHSRPHTPKGDQNDSYAQGKRPPQPRVAEALDQRFVFPFGGSRSRPQSQNIPPSSGAQRFNGAGAAIGAEEKRRTLFGGKLDLPEAKEGKHGHHHHHHHGSMSDLKRFFKFGSSKKDKRDKSPAPSTKGRSGTATPPSRGNSVTMPFAEDHGLEAKYGKFGKMLGSGAGGSVRIMKRQSDGTVFAVKQFRDRHSYETEKEYSKKVTAEFCIGSTLHHGNIIETMDIVHEKGKWYEVMEYAPYDLFAIVMTGKMSREEVSCCTLQILAGVTYLHSMGLAHRDLKLDNVVVNEYGIMKIIDFGSAAVFRYPFENDIVLASGIVGSDPYLAPEVYDQSKYDPQPTDIWSLAIIFCCMTLRRFPWKAPRLSDNSYKLFVTEPTEEERRLPGYPQVVQSEPASRQTSDVNDDSASTKDRTHRRGKSHDDSAAKSEPNTRHNNSSNAPNSSSTSTSSTAMVSPQQPPAQVIKGPWRLLRLLPRETRHIIGQMLEIDPRKRATLEEIHRDPWVLRSPTCRQEEGGKVIRAEGHTHTLEPGNGGGASESKKK